ncbi:MAG: hypothetical protein KME16_01065 [Scytolyngbya sp. HA4215-MV1]|jgi:hypothetical protein|nr:hypothetical protein [Scytolyngbya sp. HA4215-MV1]
MTSYPAIGLLNRTCDPLHSCDFQNSIDPISIVNPVTPNPSLRLPVQNISLKAPLSPVLENIPVSTFHTNHPRLFLTASNLSQIRTAIQVNGSPQQAAFYAMKARVDQNNWRIYDDQPADTNWNYARSYMAREAALMYQITNNPWYARVAYALLHAIDTDPDPDGRLPDRGYGLSRATVGMGFALAYDWAASGWTPPQREEIRGRILASLDAWTTYHHANLSSTDFASNWVAVCRGAELVMLLAIGEEGNRASRYHQLKSWLNTHLTNAYGSSGWTQEGLGYDSYAGQFLLPAVYAAQSIGDTDLDAAFNRRSFWRLAMMSGSFTPRRMFLMSGVDGGSIGDQGWMSLLFNSVPISQRPYFQYFYDRQMGLQSALPPARSFDPDHAGTVWALLYYPTRGSAIDPNPVFNHTLGDTQKGAFFFRDRWQDENDVLVSIMADIRHHDKAWDQAEALQLGLIAYNTRFMGGPGKNGTRNAGMSALLVDGNAQVEGADVGALDVTDLNPSGSGYVIVDGGQKYARLGLRRIQRHFLVDFSGNGGAAVFSTLDRIQADTSHTYTWQLNLGDNLGNGGVSVTTSIDAGLPSFTLFGKNGSYLKGWVLAPSQGTIVPADPFQITTTGRNANLWIAMVLGTGAPPTALVSGKGLNRVLQVGKARIYYNAASDRIVNELLCGSACR